MPFPRRTRDIIRSSAFIAVVLLAVTGCQRESAGASPVLRELDRLGAARSVAPRLSLATEYRPCAVQLPPDGTISQTRCPPGELDREGQRRLRRLATGTSAASRTVAPDSLRAVALIDLLWSGPSETALHRSISRLQTAARLARRPAPVLADLAGAHLVRAERTQSARDLLEALEAAEEAVALEPRNPGALFNRALALDRLRLAFQAAGAWRAYLAVDSVSGWAREATARERELRAAAAPAPPSLPGPASPADSIAAYAAAAPQSARLYGWEQVLRTWGEAVLRGDSATAGGQLRLAGALGDALERRGGDATLADAVRAIDAARRNPALTRTLAEAHQAYGRGRAAYLAGATEDAAGLLARVLALRPPSPALRGSAVLVHAATLVYDEKLAQAEAALRTLIASADSTRHPSLSGGAYWALATTLLRGGRYEPALAAAGAGERHFARTGEREHLGGIQGLRAAIQLEVGATADGYASLHRALTTLEPLRGSVWLHNQLSSAASAAAADGYARAALRFQDEDVEVARLVGRTEYVPEVEARLGRALLLAAAGDLTRARADVAAGQALIRQLNSGWIRDWYQVDAWLARAAVAQPREPAQAAAALDSIMLGSPGTSLRLLQTLIGRAQAKLRLGDPAAAEADLDSATALLARQRSAIASSPLRAALLDGAQAVFDGAAMLRLRGGDAAGALRYLERGRLSFAPAAGQQREADSGWRIPAGETALVYALVGDTLLTWALSGDRVHLARSPVDRAELARTIERARTALEFRAGEREVLPDLAALYDRLIRPVERWVGSGGAPLVVVADGELAAVPFAALYDNVRRRYLVEAVTPRFASSLRDAWQPARRPAAAHALFVANPAFERRAYPELQRLPGADQEVASASAAYARRTVLRDTAASRAALAAALRRASVVHFAGHALFDDERPDRSSLLLAPGPDGSGAITAAEIEGMDLRHVRLLVLSACQTLRSRSGRSGGFAGFASAALSAGVGGVVGSAWRVDDALTRALMTAFHQEYRASNDGARALRAAQLRLLKSPDPSLRSPAAWGGFRYAGN